MKRKQPMTSAQRQARWKARHLRIAPQERGDIERGLKQLPLDDQLAIIWCALRRHYPERHAQMAQIAMAE